MISFIFAVKDNNWKICQNIVTTPEKEQISLLPDELHNGRCNLYRGFIETLRLIKEKYFWQRLTKDVGNFMKNCNIWQQTKTCRKILDRLLTPRAYQSQDMLEIPSRNHVLTVRDELNKFSYAHALSDKANKTLISMLMLYFQYYGTACLIHSDGEIAVLMLVYISAF